MCVNETHSMLLMQHLFLHRQGAARMTRHAECVYCSFIIVNWTLLVHASGHTKTDIAECTYTFSGLQRYRPPFSYFQKAAQQIFWRAKLVQQIFRQAKLPCSTDWAWVGPVYIHTYSRERKKAYLYSFSVWLYFLFFLHRRRLNPICSCIRETCIKSRLRFLMWWQCSKRKQNICPLQVIR